MARTGSPHAGLLRALMCRQRRLRKLNRLRRSRGTRFYPAKFSYSQHCFPELLIV